MIKGVHQIKVPLTNSPLEYINVYLVEGGDGNNILIDTGWDTADAFEGLVSGLKQTGFGFGSIKQIIVTHVHVDHFGLASKIRQLSDARICTHQVEADLIQSRYVNLEALIQETGIMLARYGVPAEETRDLQRASLPAKPYAVPVKPDVEFKGGEVITAGSTEFEIIHTPGHSPGHICVYERSRKLLFSGDLVMLEITPNVSFHTQSGDNPLADFMKSLETVAGLEVNFVFPGHGPVFSGLRQRIGEIIHHHEQRQLIIRNSIQNELKTAYQIAREIKWINGSKGFSDLSVLNRRLAVTETIAHLQFLVSEGNAKRIQDSNVYKYWAGG